MIYPACLVFGLGDQACLWATACDVFLQASFSPAPGSLLTSPLRLFMTKTILQRAGDEKTAAALATLFVSPQPKKPLVLKYKNGCCECYKNAKPIILMQSQRAGIHVSMFLFVFQNVWTITSRNYSEAATGHQCSANYDHRVLHRTEISCFRYSAKMNKLNQLYFIAQVFLDLQKVHRNFHRRMRA
jgi:hypothetical protein